jgi:galactitol-specific phosphotransferase system IIB component
MINKIREHKRLSLIIMIVLFIMFLPLTFSKYKSNVDIKVKTTTGEIVYDINIDQNNKYIEDDNTYIYININNYKIIDNIKYINNVDYNYDLIITGKDLEFSIDKDNYKEELIYNNSFNKDEESNKIKVYVKNTKFNNSNDIKVELKASQKDMEAIQ